jgi:hypothetical protein
MVYKPGSMPLRDAQFMELRQFQVTEVARIFGIPPHKLGDLSHATFSNIEEQNLDYVIGTLRRWLVRWEQECNRKLIAPLEKTQQFTEHLVDGLLRGNIQSRYGAYAQGIMNGFLAPNDIRAFENLDPIPGGDTYLVQGAMVPLDRLDDLVDARIAPEPAQPVPAALAPESAPAPDDGRMARLVGDLRAGARDVVLARLVRRELAQLRKRLADPTAAASRLEKFYRRWVLEAADELAPWLPEPLDFATAWADRAMQDCVTALQGGTLGDVVHQWESSRAGRFRDACEEAMADG